MKICQPHWERMKGEVKRMGAWDLVSGSGEELAQKLSQSGSDSTLKNYDPLMDANLMITERALKIGGAYLVFNNPDDPDGHYCPLCELAKYSTLEIVEQWITGAVGAAIEHAKTL